MANGRHGIEHGVSLILSLTNRTLASDSSGEGARIVCITMWWMESQWKCKYNE